MGDQADEVSEAGAEGGGVGEDVGGVREGEEGVGGGVWEGEVGGLRGVVVWIEGGFLRSVG